MKQKNRAYWPALAICLGFFLCTPMTGLWAQKTTGSQSKTQTPKEERRAKKVESKKEKDRQLHLVFDADGKLVEGYLPRYRPGLCKGDCKVDSTLSVLVKIPVNYFKDEKEKMDERARDVYKAIRDSTSTFYQVMLSCDKDSGYLKKIRTIISDSTIDKWTLSNKDDTLLVPRKILEYAKFISALGSAQSSIDTLNKYKLFAPFRLKVKGSLLDTSCMRFVRLDKKDDKCDCFNIDDEFIGLEFYIPPAFITKDLTPDAFELVRDFAIKDVAITWYNNMLKAHKSDLLTLKLLERKIKLKQETVRLLLYALDSLQALEIYCNDTIQRAKLETGINNRICEYRKVLDAEYGAYDCNSNCKNVLLCSKALRNWVSKLFWLNGDLIRINPFDFSTTKNFVPRQNEEKDKANKLLQEQAKARIQLKFWDTAINHLEDSVLLVKGMSIDTVRKLLDSLLLLRDKALAVLSQKVQENAGDESMANAQTKRGFVTTSQVNYRGWFVPYRSMGKNAAYKKDKIWLRNYYLDQVPSPLRYKLHYTYPEDENVTILLHNIPSGTRMAVSEASKPFADSAAFTVMAGEFVTQAASLYASLGEIAPIIKKLLKSPKNYTFTGSNDNTVSKAKLEIQTPNKGFRGFSNIIREYSFNDLPDLIKQTENIYSEVINGAWYKEAYVKLILVNVRGEKIDSLKTLNYKEYITEKIPVIYKRASEKSKIQATDSISVVCFEKVDTCYIHYLQSLYSIATAPAFFDEALEARKDTTPKYYTDMYSLSDKEAPYENAYSIKTYTKDGDKVVPQLTVDSSYIKVGKFRYLQTAAGIAFTPKAGFITSVDTSNGGFSISRDEDRFRLIVGLRWYPWGLYNQKNPVGLFREGRWLHRLSVLAATGIPKPLQNMYAGVGFDIVPGLNFTAGFHFQQQNKYTIVNNQVKDRSVGYREHVFYGMTIDPGLLINVVKSLF